MPTPKIPLSRLGQCLHDYARQDKKSLFDLALLAAIRNLAQRIGFTSADQITAELPIQAIGSEGGATPEQVNELLTGISTELMCAVPKPHKDNYTIGDLMESCYEQLQK